MFNEGINSMTANDIFFGINNSLPIGIIVLCGILVILIVITYLSAPFYSGSLHTTFRHGDPFMRSRLPYINLTYTTYDGLTNFPPQGYTPVPVRCSYSFVYDLNDRTLSNALRAGIVHDGISNWNGNNGIIVQAETIFNPVRSVKVPFDFSPTALHAYGTSRVYIWSTQPPFTYDFHGRNMRCVHTMPDPFPNFTPPFGAGPTPGPVPGTLPGIRHGPNV